MLGENDFSYGKLRNAFGILPLKTAASGRLGFGERLSGPDPCQEWMIRWPCRLVKLCAGEPDGIIS